MTQQTTENSNDLDTIKRYLDAFTITRLLYLVDREEFNKIPATLRAYATNAPPELVDQTSFAFRSSFPLYVFTTESAFYNGAARLKKEGKLKGQEFNSVSVSPALLLQKIAAFTPEIVVDYGQRHSYIVPSGEVARLVRLSTIASIARLGVVHVLQGASRAAVTLELDGKTFAVGYLKEEHAEPAMSQLASDGGKCALDEAEIKKLALGLLDSDLDGIVIHPGGETETILNRDDLNLLVAVVGLLKGPGLLGMLRQILPSAGR